MASFTVAVQPRPGIQSALGQVRSKGGRKVAAAIIRCHQLGGTVINPYITTRRRGRGFFWLALALAAGAASAVFGAGAVPQVRFSEYRLTNGLRVILAPDRTAPVIAVNVTYDVGSRNERPGRSGFAHLFEHMMFQGSANVGKGEHGMLVSDNGGNTNGTTNQDRTNYFEALPANQLDLALFLEADRMRSLDISQENLDNQRAVVQEEKRQRYDNQPYGLVHEKELELTYTGFPYKHTTIGSMEDLNAANLTDIREFFKIYYAPNNAVLAVAGDFDTGEAKRKIQKYFGDISSQPAPPPVSMSEPAPTGERRVTLDDRLARLPRYTAAYRTVSGSDPDFYALNVLGDVLAGGRLSRLYAALVDKNVALSVMAGPDETRGPGLFDVIASLPPNGELEAVEKAINAEVERVKRDGVTEEELVRVKAGSRTATVGGLRTALSRANDLALYAVYYNDPGRINTLLPKLEAVTPTDVQRVARKYLTPENRVVILSKPAGRPQARTGGGQP